jgi:hypothetical protein
MGNAFGFKTSRKLLLALLVFNSVLFLTIFATGCSKKPPSNQASDTTSANTNQNDQSALALYAQANLKGDIERISLAISMAKDSAKLDKWQEAAAALRAAKSTVDTALTRKPSLQDEFESLKVDIDRAIPLVESGAKEADAKLNELQTKIGAIKTNTF